MAWHELFPTHKRGYRKGSKKLKISVKQAIFLLSSAIKNNFQHFLLFFSCTQAYGYRKGGKNLKISPKDAVFLISRGKNPISPLLAHPRKAWKNPLVDHWKNFFRRPCTQACKMTSFFFKLCCVTPSGNTVQQHQFGKQSIAGWQTVGRVFCQTITKSCQIHCQITNMLEIISTKYCQNSPTFLSLNDLLYHWTQY